MSVNSDDRGRLRQLLGLLSSMPILAIMSSVHGIDIEIVGGKIGGEEAEIHRIANGRVSRWWAKLSD